MTFSTFWTLQFRDKHLPGKLHYYVLSISISFLHFLSRSARNKGNKNATGTSSELKDVTQFMDFSVSESALGS